LAVRDREIEDGSAEVDEVVPRGQGRNLASFLDGLAFIKNVSKII
jgi:hypothetical protein